MTDPVTSTSPTLHPNGEPRLETALLAGGCFWGMQDLIRKIPGVVRTDVGYTGGPTPAAGYHEVKTGRTGHAEAVRVVFDPKQLSYAELLEKWFFRMHDPTTKSRQGNDVGTQYRSAIYFHSPEQEQTAHELTKIYGDEISRRGYGEITTEIGPAGSYHYAEAPHQQYLHKNPYGYRCHANTGVPFPE